MNHLLGAGEKRLERREKLDISDWTGARGRSAVIHVPPGHSFLRVIPFRSPTSNVSLLSLLGSYVGLAGMLPPERRHSECVILRAEVNREEEKSLV